MSGQPAAELILLTGGPPAHDMGETAGLGTLVRVVAGGDQRRTREYRARAEFDRLE